jgi:hypothetical protein
MPDPQVPQVPPPEESREEEVRRPARSGVAIEWGDGRNNNFVFAPTQERYRGRYSPHNYALGDTSGVGLMTIPAFPGIQLGVDLRARRCWMHDPLSREENRALAAQVFKIEAAVMREGLHGPVPDQIWNDQSDDELASWLYWMMRAVRAKTAEVVSGTMPMNEAEIKRLVPKGKIRRDYYQATIADYPQPQLQ